MTVRYVPDKLVLAPEAFAGYLERIAEEVPRGAEALALAILADITDELVPRWIQVQVDADGAPGYSVLVEDRQPNWDNPPLLSRLARF